jgi:thiol-disulfide isomerase/thioredoxin
MLRFLVLALSLAVSLLALDAPGEIAPAFRAKTIDGRTFDNESLKGKVVLIQFWTTWCGYCRADQPAVEKLTEEHGDKLVVLAVSVNESKGKVKKYLEGSPRKSRIVLTEDTNLAAAFEVRGFPMYVVLNQKGLIAARHDGAATPVLSKLLAKGGLN